MSINKKKIPKTICKKKWAVLISTHISDGWGHLKRSISIFDCLSEYTDVDLFILNKNYEIEKFLKSKKYNYRLFMFSTFKPYYGILVDSYKFSNLKYKKLKLFSKKIVVFKDHQILPNTIDLAISPFYKNKKIKKYKILYGNKYCHISKEYERSNIIYNRLRKPKTILISFGMIDKLNMGFKVLNIINKMKIDCQIIYVSNKKNIFKVNNNIIKNKIKLNLKTYINLDSLLDMYKRSDIVIGSAGQSLLERIILGIPSITIPTSKNQKLLSRWVNNNKSSILINNSIKDFNKVLTFNLQKLLFDKKFRFQIHRNCSKLIDGNGSKRIVKQLLKM